MQKPRMMTVSSMMLTMAADLRPPAEKYSVTTTAAMMMPKILSMPATTFRIQAIPSSWPENRARVPIAIMVDVTPRKAWEYRRSR